MMQTPTGLVLWSIWDLSGELKPLSTILGVNEIFSVISIGLVRWVARFIVAGCFQFAPVPVRTRVCVQRKAASGGVSTLSKLSFQGVLFLIGILFSQSSLHIQQVHTLFLLLPSFVTWKQSLLYIVLCLSFGVRFRPVDDEIKVSPLEYLFPELASSCSGNYLMLLQNTLDWAFRFLSGSHTETLPVCDFKFGDLRELRQSRLQSTLVFV